MRRHDVIGHQGVAYRAMSSIDAGPTFHIRRHGVRSFSAAPSLNMLHTCTQVQQELLPLYFSIVTPHFSIPSRDGFRTRTFTHSFQTEVVAWLDKQGLDAVDYFHAIFLRSSGLPYVDCSIKIHKPMVVEARVRSCKMYEGCEGLEASTNQTLAEKITESLKSPTQDCWDCDISSLPKRSLTSFNARSSR